MAKKDLMTDILKAIDSEYAGIAENGVIAGDVAGWIDTGSYALNALLSGSIYCGLASNKVTAFSGESAVGKTYFALGILKHFQRQHPEGIVLLYESESAITKQMLKERGLDTKRVLVISVETIEEFKTAALRAVSVYLEADVADRKPLFICLDSLGMLSTEKELAEAQKGRNKEGKYVKDMTRAQLIKSAFRTLTLKLGKANIPLLITNHVYSVIGAMVPTNESSGGSGPKYAASTNIVLSRGKARKKDTGGGSQDMSVIGNLITCTAQKSRLTKENSRVKVLLSYDRGLSRYYGLIEMAESAGVFTKSGAYLVMPDGKKVYRKAIHNEPTKYFTKEVLDAIDEWTQKEFTYANISEEELLDSLTEEDATDE